jgi:hypothetical protein
MNEAFRPVSHTIIMVEEDASKKWSRLSLRSQRPNTETLVGS